MDNEGKQTIEFWIRGSDIKGLNENEDHYIVVTWGKKEDDLNLYIDGKKVDFARGAGRDFRVSKIVRNEAWIKASFKTATGKLLTFGKEEKKK